MVPSPIDFNDPDYSQWSRDLALVQISGKPRPVSSEKSFSSTNEKLFQDTHHTNSLEFWKHTEVIRFDAIDNNTNVDRVSYGDLSGEDARAFPITSSQRRTSSQPVCRLITFLEGSIWRRGSHLHIGFQRRTARWLIEYVLGKRHSSENSLGK